MKRLLVVAMLGLFACSEDSELPPSPLAEFEKARLYLLVKAGGGVKPICKDYFADPQSAQTTPYATECLGWQTLMADHLTLNGIQNLDPRHLQAQNFWQWWSSEITEITACRADVQRQDAARREKKEPGWRTPDMAAFRDCDPYDRAIQSEGKTLEELGIRRRVLGSLEGDH